MRRTVFTLALGFLAGAVSTLGVLIAAANLATDRHTDPDPLRIE